MLVHEQRFYVIDILRGRFEFPVLLEHAKAQALNYNPNRILVEDCFGIGHALVTKLSKAELHVIAIKPEADKRTRMAIQSVKFKNGQVLLPREAPWLAELEAELFKFPNVAYDDQVDAVSCHSGEPYYAWTDRANENFARLIGALAFPF